MKPQVAPWNDKTKFCEAVLTALTQGKPFVITKLPAEFTEQIKYLESAFTKTLSRFSKLEKEGSQSAQEELTQHTGEVTPDGFATGHFSDYFASVVGANRYFTGYKQNTLVDKGLSEQVKQSLQKAIFIYIEIQKTIASTLEDAFDIQPGTLTQQTTEEAVFTASRYRVFTQEYIRQIYADKELIIKDKQVVTFCQHQDFSPLAMLYYPKNKTRGLTVYPNGPTESGEKVDISDQQEEITLLGFAGKELDIMTHGRTPPLWHAVTTPPEKPKGADERLTLAFFNKVAAPRIEASKMRTGEKLPLAPGCRYTYPVDVSTLLQQNLESIKAARNSKLCQELPEGWVAQFPTEQELKATKTANADALCGQSFLSNTPTFVFDGLAVPEEELASVAMQ